MKITKEYLKKLIKEVAGTELALQQALAADRKRNPQAGPHYRRSEHEGDPGLFDRVGTNIKRGIERMYDPEAPEPGDITGPTPVPVKDPRPVRVASTDPTSPNHLRKKINALHASGRISRETKIAARRALHGKGGKYDPEMGVEAAMAILRDAGVRIDLKEAYESYEMVPGSGEEGVSGLVDPLQSMERPEPEEEMSPAALRKQRAERWAMAQGLEDFEDPTARFKPRANTRDTSGIHPAEFGDTYAKLFTLGSGEDIGQPGDPSRLPDSFAERRPRGSDEDFIAKALEEMIREETEAVLAEASPAELAKNRANKYCAEKGEEDAKCKEFREKHKNAERIERARKAKR